MTRLTDNEPVAVDVAVTHPFATHLGVNQAQARVALRAKERQKMLKYAHQQLLFSECRAQRLQRVETALMQQLGKRMLACCGVLDSSTAIVA